MFWSETLSQRSKATPHDPISTYSTTIYLESTTQALYGIYQPGLILMQDNAPIHTAKAVALWFRENGIDVMEGPPTVQI